MNRISTFAIAALFVVGCAHEQQTAEGTSAAAIESTHATMGPGYQQTMNAPQPEAAPGCPVAEAPKAPSCPIAQAAPVQAPPAAQPCEPPNCTCVPYAQEEKQPVAGHEEPCEADCKPVKVHFAFDSAELNDDAKTVLKRTATCLKAKPGMDMTIEGGADQRGGEEYNKILGGRRAAAVAAFLESEGVCKDRLDTVSLGKDHPICNSHDEKCFAQNRRAEVRPGKLTAAAERTLQ